ncbi:trypsin-like serine protease [Streptomyces sp. NPDC048595]|uniref:trypsin-like serine protease n=1 Tax=Streptomyces sp. NPDC048595 TaxID=3365576 RepID=UPI0037181491
MSAQIATSRGTWAEQVCLPARLLAAAPTTLALEDAAALPLAGVTALQALNYPAARRHGRRHRGVPSGHRRPGPRLGPAGLRRHPCDTPANRLRSADLRVLPGRTCQRLNPGGDYDPKMHVCANDPVTGAHHAEGDSGGPLVAGGRLIGIVSWLANSDDTTPTPGVYTRVAAFSREIARQIRDV